MLGLASAPSALACGSAAYSYAGLSSRSAVYGVGATLTSLASPAVQNGHVAGWVGVGGPGLGPRGSSEWIQVGYSSFHGTRLGSLYYEVAQPGRSPRYHEISTTIHEGERHRVAVLEVAHHANWWRVWVDGHAASRPYHLPGSHGTWPGIATAENWGGGVRACNLYSYRFDRVVFAHGPGGDWRRMNATRAMHQGENRFLPASAGSFVARTDTLPGALTADSPTTTLPTAGPPAIALPIDPPAPATTPAAADAFDPGPRRPGVTP